jgi:uncharacterized protein
MKLILVFLFPVLTLLSCISYHITEKDLFYPRKVAKLDQSLQLEEVYFTTTDSVQINGWFIKQPHPQGTILFLGGDGFYLWEGYIFDVINTLSSFKMNILFIDYRGYDRSGGIPTIHGIFEDSESAYRYLCSRSDVDSTQIIVYGHSFGSFVAVHVGSSFPVAGVVLEGAISNTSDMKDIYLKTNAPWYVRWLVNVDADSVVLSLNNLTQIHHLSMPVLVITGSNDQIAPPEMGKKVYDSASSTVKQFEIIPNGQHNDLYLTADGRREKYLAVVSKFLDEVLKHRQIKK